MTFINIQVVAVNLFASELHLGKYTSVKFKIKCWSCFTVSIIWAVVQDDGPVSATSVSRLLRLCACCSIVSAVWCLGGRPGLPLFGFRPSFLGRLDLPDPLGLPGRRGTICLVESACTCLHVNRNREEFAISTAALGL